MPSNGCKCRVCVALAGIPDGTDAAAVLRTLPSEVRSTLGAQARIVAGNGDDADRAAVAEAARHCTGQRFKGSPT